MPATLASGNAPFAEVFTVISEDVIQVLAKPRTRSRYDFRFGKGPRSVLNCENAFPIGELFQRHFLNWTALPTVGKTGVMHYASVSDVDAVMFVKGPVSDHMGARRK